VDVRGSLVDTKGPIQAKKAVEHAVGGGGVHSLDGVHAFGHRKHFGALRRDFGDPLHEVVVSDVHFRVKIGHFYFFGGLQGRSRERVGRVVVKDLGDVVHALQDVDVANVEFQEDDRPARVGGGVHVGAVNEAVFGAQGVEQDVVDHRNDGGNEMGVFFVQQNVGRKAEDENGGGGVVFQIKDFVDVAETIGFARGARRLFLQFFFEHAQHGLRAESAGHEKNGVFWVVVVGVDFLHVGFREGFQILNLKFPVVFELEAGFTVKVFVENVVDLAFGVAAVGQKFVDDGLLFLFERGAFESGVVADGDDVLHHFGQIFFQAVGEIFEHGLVGAGVHDHAPLVPIFAAGGPALGPTVGEDVLQEVVDAGRLGGFVDEPGIDAALHGNHFGAAGHEDHRVPLDDVDLEQSPLFGFHSINVLKISWDRRSLYIIYLNSMKGCIVLLGESFRWGGQGNRNTGSIESYEGQMDASKSQMTLIQKWNMDVYISSYVTRFTMDLVNVYKGYIKGYDFYTEVIGQENLMQQTLLQIDVQRYSFCFMMRIDLFLKPQFIEIFNPFQWNKIMWPSVCWTLGHICGEHPRVNDVMVFIPNQYFEYLKYLGHNHAEWAHLVHFTDLNPDDVDVMLNTYHDSDSAKDFNPIYYIVNRPECKVHYDTGKTFCKLQFYAKRK